MMADNTSSRQEVFQNIILAPNLIHDRIKFGYWPVTADFKTNEYGVVTYLAEPHQKYSLDLKKGFYLEDWIPEILPDGQKLIFAHTHYVDYNQYGEDREKYEAHYNFASADFVIDEQTSDFDLIHNKGFRVTVIYNSEEQDEMEDILEGSRERHAKKYGNYGGYTTMMHDGEMAMLFEGGYDRKHYENSIYWKFDEHYTLSLKSHYYTVDELIPVFESIRN